MRLLLANSDFAKTYLTDDKYRGLIRAAEAFMNEPLTSISNKMLDVSPDDSKRELAIVLLRFLDRKTTLDAFKQQTAALKERVYVELLGAKPLPLIRYATVKVQVRSCAVYVIKIAMDDDLHAAFERHVLGDLISVDELLQMRTCIHEGGIISTNYIVLSVGRLHNS